jgi:hypothetical protein
MSGHEVLLAAEEGDAVSLRGTDVVFKVRGDNAGGASCLEFVAAPGFDTGLHVHSKLEEPSTYSTASSSCALARRCAARCPAA